MRAIITWVYTVLLTFAFIGAGASKLAAQPIWVEQFRSFGYPLWFMTLTGAIEFGCSILVLVPRFASVAAGILACVMGGAVVSHLVHGQTATVVPPALLFVLALAVTVLRSRPTPETGRTATT